MQIEYRVKEYYAKKSISIIIKENDRQQVEDMKKIIDV